MNSIVHFEIPATDPAKLSEFYQKTFGWKIQAVPEMQYWMAHTTETSKEGIPQKPGAINGGFMKGQRGDPTVLVIGVPDLDAHLKKVEKAGGKVVMPKTPVGDMGLYARFQDPQGNVLGIWQDLKR